MKLVGPDGSETPEFTAADLERAASEVGKAGPRGRAADRLKADPDFEAAAQVAYRTTANELRSFVERLEQVAAEAQDVREHKAEIFAEAKARGYDCKALRKILKLRASDPAQVAEEQAVLDIYLEALGMGGAS